MRNQEDQGFPPPQLEHAGTSFSRKSSTEEDLKLRDFPHPYLAFRNMTNRQVFLKTKRTRAELVVTEKNTGYKPTSRWSFLFSFFTWMYLCLDQMPQMVPSVTWPWSCQGRVSFQSCGTSRRWWNVQDVRTKGTGETGDLILNNRWSPAKVNWCRLLTCSGA